MRLTLPQQDVYYEQLLYSEEPIYNIGAKIRIEGPLQIEAFECSYMSLIQQHDVYRTVFFKSQGGTFNQQLKEEVAPLRFQNFSKQNNSETKACEFMQQEFMKPFQLSEGEPLYRFVLVKVAENKHYLFSVYHHIITDGWGTSLMFKRLVKNYNEILEFGKIVSDYPFSYEDFVEDDMIYQQSEAFEKDKKYWVEKFKLLPKALFEKTKINKSQHKSEREVLFIKREVYNDLNRLAKINKSSAFHIILALLYLYFGRKHQNQDFAIGLPVLNRSKASYKKTVGLFMGVLPLRIEWNQEINFDELITIIKKQLRQDYRYQRFPLGKLIQELQVFNEKDRLMNITLSYEKQDYADHFQNTKTTVIPMTHQSERVALAMYIREFDEKEDVTIDFDYNLNYFDSKSISQVTAHFQVLLNNILNKPNKKLCEFEYLPPEEKQQLLQICNDTSTSYPPEITLLDIFNEKVRQYRKKMAVQDENIALSYRQLEQLSNNVAKNLIEANDAKVIGVLLDRSVYTVVILLGILKSGKSYIPLDPTFPKNRLRYIMEHSQLNMLICDSTNTLSFEEYNVLFVDELIRDVGEKNKQGLPKATAIDTAYIIYTSGSTGNPKGVEITHGSLINFLLSIREEPGITSTDLLFAVTTYSFDISILEFFVPLITGASVYIASNAILSDYTNIVKALDKVSPSILQGTPSFFQLLLHGGWKGNLNTKILCGGDLLSEDLAAQLLIHCSELWNMYGPTETTIWSSVKRIKHATESSNIGSPIANTQFYILDKQLQLLPIGNNGVLYIGGHGLAKGYFKDPKRTHEKFIKNPYGDGLLYNTNDLAKWNENGELIFLGRNDNQVKIRGYRIELGDIESKLNQIPQIRKSVVVSKKQKGQEAFLIAYIQKEDASYDVQDSVEFLRKELPQYMIPYVLLPITDFPLTPNKKIDRKKLVSQELPSMVRLYTYPKTELQKELIELWKEVLQYTTDISLTDNFFALGGHSLNAVKLSHSINETYGYNIGLKTIFEYPTIATLSGFLEKEERGISFQISKASPKELYSLTPSQHEIWLACQVPERLIAYNMVAAYEVNGSVDIHKMRQSVIHLINKNEILRTNFIEKQGQVYQKIKSAEEIEFEVFTTDAPTQEDAKRIIYDWIHTSFDLKNDVLLRMMLIQISKRESVLVFCTHHIIMDGISLEFFSKQFLENYQIPKNTHSPHSLQFKDYSEWLHKFDREEANQFYKDYLGNYQIKESITPDVLFSKKDSCTGNHYLIEFKEEQTQLLKRLGKQYETTPYSIIATLASLVIYSIEGHEDIVIGTVHSGRSSENIASMIGMFVKTLPLRIQCSSQFSFLQLLQQIQEQLVLLNKYQYASPSVIKKNLFDVLITYQNPDFSYRENVDLEDFTLTYLPIDTKYSRVPLLFNFFEVHNSLHLTLTYDTNTYEVSTAQFIVELFEKILESIEEDPLVLVSVLKEKVLKTSSSEEMDFDFNF
ncbi:non-ribosomal peptide synthetase [Aquimarina sp. RZ0]|uniref:non-ribosomal peptide synthetase n=1 Tax=Aquimarina sp. RZ0 TaxID=2607730 RepID=UPI0011F0E5DF|nr:non-ribosomal peptide synthetase [Aquimarina sp. RZ0]KAA1243809.1 amino acid adenylation domain-containing protein [Aquimarina sp. RZ0]